MATLTLPPHLSFKQRDLLDFDAPLSWFDWSIKDTNVIVDLRDCGSANYQTLALLVLYVWHLRANGCDVRFIDNNDSKSASAMWRMMGARGWSQVLFESGQNFRGHRYKPLIAVRDQGDFGKALSRVEEYTHGFDVEYEKTLRYIVSELLYNTLEHGQCRLSSRGKAIHVPSIIQFTWYKKRDEIALIIADIGVGIKAHLEQAYPTFETAAEAIRYAIKPNVSGTFGRRSEYGNKNNAGVGLFLSTSIAQRLQANMFIVSGNGLLHISPRDITSRSLKCAWPGTFAYFTLGLKRSKLRVSLHSMMAELRESARSEMKSADDTDEMRKFVVGIENFFGRYAENKSEAINYRDRHLIVAIDSGKEILLDFRNVVSSTHSFLSALLATPVQKLGIQAYKRIRVIGASADIRETIDYIMDENTR